MKIKIDKNVPFHGTLKGKFAMPSHEIFADIAASCPHLIYDQGGGWRLPRMANSVTYK